MRFAGSRLEGYLGKGIDAGQMAQSADNIRTKEGVNNIEAQTKVGTTGIAAQAKIAAAEAGAAATRSQGEANMFSSIMGGIGKIGGAAIGQFGGGGINSYDDIPSAGLTGSDAGAGAGSRTYFGTGEKYGSFTPPTPTGNGMFSFNP